VNAQPKEETVEKMNTSEDEEAMTAPLRSANPVNGEINGDLKTRTGKPKPKPRAKLSSIIQKLIDGVPARLEQLSKAPAVSATSTASAERGGAIGSLGHSLTHKVSFV